MLKYLLMIFAIVMAACGGTPDAEDHVGSQSQSVFVTKKVFVRKGTKFPTLAQDPLRNPLGMSTNPNDMGGSVVQGIQINKAVPGNGDSGQYTTTTVPRASISVQVSEYDAIRDFVNAAAASGRQVVMSFVIQDLGQRSGVWQTVGAPTWVLRGTAPVTAIMNVFPGRRANTDPAVSQFSIDWDTGSTDGFESVFISRNPGFYEGLDYFRPSLRAAFVALNDTGWNNMVSVLDDPTHNARVQITYESADPSENKPLLGLPFFTIR